MFSNLSLAEKQKLADLEGDRHARLGADEVLDRITQLVCLQLGVPTGLVTLLGSEHQWIKAKRNFGIEKSLRQSALCQRTTTRRELTIIEDALLDDEFHDNPFVNVQKGIRFYAGAPLITSDGHAIGSVCAIDYQPRKITEEQGKILCLLADVAVGVLEARDHVGFIDPVTLLPNRQQLLKDLCSNELLQTPPGEQRTLLFVEVVRQSYLYDLTRSFGLEGVEILTYNIANAIKLSLPERHAVYSITLSRFAIVAPSDSRDLALGCLEALSERLRNNFQTELPIKLSLSVGFYDYDPAAEDSSAVFRKAFSALHESILSGTRVMSYRVDFDDQQRSKIELINDLSTAIETSSGLYLVFQPKVCVKTGRVMGAEALIRWEHPTRGPIYPNEFMPLVDQTNLINPLTFWVLRQAVIFAKSSVETGDLIVTSINVTTSNLIDPSFLNTVVAILEEEGGDPAWLEVECLETEQLLKNPQALQTLFGLRDLGFGIALDDFGAGHSNLNYLRRIPAGVVKIDRSLISNITSDEASRYIVKSIIDMIHFLKATVVAEGVEDQRTFEELRDMGCDCIQGFYFYRPMRAEALLDLIRRS